MHKLDRAAIEPPECLTDYDHKTSQWNDIRSACKALVRRKLVQMQGIPGITTEDAQEYGVRCAYCESAIHHQGHIEHFRRKNPGHFPELTFAWENLFLACGSSAHCGHYKDRPGAAPYDPNNLIKPDDHDPDEYLYFHSSGQVRVSRFAVGEAKQHRAEETIRVFHLNSPSLAAARAIAVRGYKQQMLNDLDELASWADQEREAFLQAEIAATAWEPFATTKKHFLQSRY
jgi:uncharacterized protein (TIGR02646 family)